MLTKFVCERCKETKIEVKMLADKAPAYMCEDCYHRFLEQYPMKNGML